MRFLKAILIILLLSILGFGIYHSLFNTELTLIKSVRITGANPETEARLQRLHKIPLQTSFWKIEVSQVADRMKQDSWVEDVEIKKVFPDKIEIQITERKPAAMIYKGNNQFDFVDSQNHVFGPAQNKTISQHLILSGKSFSEDAVIRKNALELLPLLKDQEVLNQNDVSEVQYTQEKGFALILSKTGIKVDLGKENLPLHLDRARRVVQYLDQHDINATHVDADYAKKVLVKVRKDR